MPQSSAELQDLLEVENLAAGYGGKAIVRGVDLRVQTGDWLGLLGANGAGKSTLLRAMTGQIPLLTGRVKVAGVDLARHPETAKRQFGYAVDFADLPATLTGRQYSRTGRLDPRMRADRLALRRPGRNLRLRPLDRPADRRLFAGTKMKLSISAAMLGAPPLLILDEALNGLDPVASWQVKQTLALLRRSGHGVIFSTHVLEVVASVCNRAVLIENGALARTWDQPELEPGEGRRRRVRKRRHGGAEGRANPRRSPALTATHEGRMVKELEVRLAMRILFLAPPLALSLALAGCNANRAGPEVMIPPPPPPQSSIRVTPPGFQLPQGGGCAGDIARFRAIQDNDLAMGHVNAEVYKQIQGDVAEADHACAQGDNLRAEGLLRATKARHGYLILKRLCRSQASQRQ